MGGPNLKVLFVYPDFQETVGGTQQHGSYSEGLGSLSAVLKAAGHEVALYHLTGPAEKADFQARIKSEGADLVAFATRTSIFPFVVDYAAWTKEVADVPTISGSYHPTLEPQETIDVPGIDMITIGESEGAIVELADALAAGKPHDNIRNLWVKKNGQIIKNPVRPLIEDLDTIPLPDFELFDFDNLASSRIKTAVVMVSRGCPYMCTYCCNHQIRDLYENKKRYTRFRSPKNAIEYLATIKRKYPYIEYVNFMDNILPMDKAWFAEFTGLYKKEIGLPFSCRFRVNLMDRETIRMLKDAGCYLIHFGVESGDDYIRNEVLLRHISVRQIKEAFEACREVGISALSYNMINLPFEDMGRILSTIKLNAELKPNRIVDTVFYPYPNTRLFDIAVENGFVEPHFDYTEEIPLRQPTLSETQVIFVQRYFRIFVRLYKMVNALPVLLRGPAERLVDRAFVTRWKPYGLLVWVANVRLKILVGAKKFLMRRMPGFYLWLRDRVVRSGRATETEDEE